MFIRKFSIIVVLALTLSACSASNTVKEPVPGSSDSQDLEVKDPNVLDDNLMDKELVKSYEIAESIVGLEMKEATDYVQDFENYSVRIVREDSESYAVTMDFRSTRINIEVDNGIVSKAFPG